MSKQRVSVLLSLCIAFVLAIYGLVASMTYIARAESVDASVSRLIGVDTLKNGDDDAKVTFVINKNLGTTSFTDSEVTGVTYTAAAGGARTVSGVTYYFDTSAVLPRIQLSFAEDSATDGAVQYAEGDTIAFTADFTFSNSDSTQTFTLGEPITVTYTGGSWTGTFIGDEISASDVTVSHNVAVYMAGGCIQFDFGFTNVATGEGLSDANGGGGWYSEGQPAWVTYETLVSHIQLTLFGDWSASRYVFKDGTIAIGDAYSHASAGSIITLKAGMPIYQTTGSLTAYYFNSASNYTPLAILGSNLSFIFDGAQWSPAPAATSATLADADAFENFGTGQSVQIEWTFGEGEYELPMYTSSDPSVATVDSDGLVTGVSDGEVTITAHFSGIGDKQIEITVGEPAQVTGFNFEIAGAATREGTKYLVAYVGEDLDKAFAASRLTAIPVYDNGLTGESFAVTADMIDTSKFDNTQTGVSAITVSNVEAYPGVSADVPVYVYEVTQVNDYVDPSRLLQHGSAINIYLFDVVDNNQGEATNEHIIDFRSHPEYGITNTMATLVEPSWVESPATHELYTVGEITFLQMTVYFGGYTNSNGQIDIPAGTVLTFTEDFRMFRYIDGTWVAYYKFPGEMKYVWDGSAWQYWEADATGFELNETEVTLPNGATYTPQVTYSPAGSYGEVTLEVTSGSDVIELDGGNITALKPGTATVTVKMGNLSDTSTIQITVSDTQALGLELVNNRTFNISEDDTSLNLDSISVRIDYGEGYYSDAIKLSDESVTVADYTLDTTLGSHTLTLQVTINDHGVDITDDVTLSIEVHDVVETYPDNMIIPSQSGAWSETLFLIYFQRTFPNTANVYATALGDLSTTITDYIVYQRADGTELDVINPGYLQNMLGFTLEENGVTIGYDRNNSGDTYVEIEEGDKIILKKGLAFYRWFGEEDSYHNVVGEGDYVKVGELAYDVTFVYSVGQGVFSWTIAPETGIALEETVSVGLGQTHATNVETVPSYATGGEWFFTVEDESVATVSVSGMITGNAIGSTEVTAVLRYNGEDIQTVTFTVTVTDSVTGIQITSSTPVRVDVGTELDVAGWIEQFGITAHAVYASGTVGTEAIDLSDARVTGYDPDTEGEQTVTFRVTVDGRSVTGTLTVTVGSSDGESGGGCSSAAIGASAALGAGVLLAGALLICLKKKKG